MFLLGLNCKGYLQKCTAYSKKDNLKRSFQEVSLMEVISCYELYSFVLFHLKAVLVIVLVLPVCDEALVTKNNVELKT